MKYMDVCSRKTYKQGNEEKTKWLKCGTVRITDDGKMFLEMNHLPNTSFFIFEQKAKEEAGEFGT